MKKLVSLLVAMAMVLSLSVTAFATSGTGFQDDPYVIESLEGGFEMTAGNTFMDSDVFYKYVAEKTGTILTDAATNVWFSVNNVLGFTWVTEGDSSVEVNAGDTLYINFSNTTPSPITAYVYYEGDEPAGGNGGAAEVIPNGGALALGNNNVELTYAMMPMQAAKWTYTATESGFLTVTVASVNGNGMLDMAFGRGMYTLLVGETDGMYTNTATAYVNAGETVNIAVLDTMDFEPVPAVLALSFETGAPVVEKNPADYFEVAANGDFLLNSLLEEVEIFVGNDDICFTYTAEMDGVISLTASVDGYAATNCGIKVNTGSWAYGAYSAQVVAGDTVRINIWQGWEGTALIMEGSGTPDVDVPENGIAIEAYGNAEWTAPEDGYVKFTIDVPGGMLAILNGFSPLGEDTETVTVQVTAGTTYGIYPGYNVSSNSIVTWEYVDAPAGGDTGDAGESIPSGGALALGDNNVSLTYAMVPMQAPYWTYTATEDGFLTVYVASINDNSNLGMAFGRGFYTLLVGETDGMGTNEATVFVAAGETVNIAVLDTMDMEPVPAVLNLSFVAGQPVVEESPDDYYEKDDNGNYIIPTLENDMYIFSGNNDVNFIYVAESAGVVTVTPLVEGTTATNCWITHNDAIDTSAAPVAVEAGDVVIINIWSGYEGTVSLTAGGSLDPDQGSMSGSNVEISATEAIEFFFTPDADGILTIKISANPGFKFWVYETATDATLSLPESGVEETFTYEVTAQTEYRVYIIGYHDWSEAAATISYEASFQASTLDTEEAELEESAVDLVVGEQNVELLPNTITTLFNFYAPEAGIYTITLPEGVTAGLYSVAWTEYQAGEGNTLVFTATADEQGFLVGLTCDEDVFNITIEKTGTYTPPASTTYLPYEPTTQVDTDFQMPEGEVTSVDISVAQTIVLGTDGYYHLGTADGPIVYVNLNTDGFTLATLLDAGAPITMRGEKFEGEDGQLYCYDYMNMIAYGDYYSYSQECDYYPLNADLLAFFKDYGAAQGWYNANFSNFEAIKNGEVNEESAWMVALVYIPGSGNQGGNQGGNTPETGDFGVVAAAVAMGISAICGTAVIAKKKEN